MNPHPPADFAPLSYGAGLALGVLLILGLPTETEPRRSAPAASPRERVTPPSRLAQPTMTAPAAAPVQSLYG